LMQTIAVAAAAAADAPAAVASVGELTMVVPSVSACVWIAAKGEIKY
jgi:hypothetical protein